MNPRQNETVTVIDKWTRSSLGVREGCPVQGDPHFRGNENPRNQFNFDKKYWVDYMITLRIDTLIDSRGEKGRGLKTYFTVFFWGVQWWVSAAFHALTSAWTTLTKRTSISDWTETRGYGKVQREGINQTIMCFVIPTRIHTFQSLSVMSARLGKERRPASGKLVKLLNLLRFCNRKVFHRWHKCSTSKSDELDGITIIVFQLLLYAHIN